MRNGMIALAGCMALAGCGGGEKSSAPTANDSVVATPAAPSPAPATRPTDGWIGRWRGVEGLNLVIAKGAAPGTYRLDMSLMDSRATHVGTAAGETIRFVRDGTTETLRHTSGAETGLKWLAQKKDCLTVKEGIGFCRD